MEALRALAMTPADWETLFESWGLPRYRGRQVFEALHRRRVLDYAAMKQLPAELRERLASELPVRLPEIARREEAADGSVKYGLRLSDRALIEAVLMPGEASAARVNEFEDARAAERGDSHVLTPALSRGERGRDLGDSHALTPALSRGERERDRGDSSPLTPPLSRGERGKKRFTVCLSSQTGCAVDCVFCVTGRLGGGRNLSAGEIVGQLYAVLADAGRGIDGLRVVFMGMGEPFLNAEGVSGALEILFEILSPRRVTVSTSGITPAFDRFAGLPRRPNLAVSINAADEETRTRLMPITRTYPLRGVVAAMRRWPLEGHRRITAEYVLIGGVNDSAEDARRLAGLLSGVPVKINVIPLNEDPVYLPGWKRPDEAVIDHFVRVLAGAGCPVTVRRSRGPDARAACGQLKGRTEDVRRQAGRRETEDGSREAP
jgi:23S rRNA (adenine2503-C2)-methyltransferase